MSGKILMPKATAVWLIDNTSLTFEQIAEFCGMHILEVQNLADNEQMENIVGVSPILNGMVSKEAITACEQNPKMKLQLDKRAETFIKESSKVKHRYTPLAHRQNKPDAILWLIKNHPEISDAQIAKLIRTTKKTIDSIRDRTHKDIADLEPKNPVLVGICTEFDLTKAVAEAKEKIEKAQAKLEKAKQKLEKQREQNAQNETTDSFEEEKELAPATDLSGDLPAHDENDSINNADSV